MKHYIFSLLLIFIFSGCKTFPEIQQAKTNNTSFALIVGMEQSNSAGACPGSQLDANNFQRITDFLNIPSQKLISKQATYKNVSNALKNITQNYDLAIFYYSGHGGQATKFDPYNVHEADGKDEFLCLYDKIMLDDDIWSIISKAKNRVVVVFDNCHAQGMWRVPVFKDKIKFGGYISTNFLDMTTPNGVLVIAGSKESEYSYGSVSGGLLTNAILKHYKKQSYRELFDLVEKDKNVRKYQEPILTNINNFDESAEFLR